MIKYDVLRKLYPFLNKYIDLKLIKEMKGIEKIKDPKNVTLFMGRGPSKGCHLGHYYIWRIGALFQKNIRCKVLFQISDDEKYYKQNYKICELKESIDEALKLLSFLDYNPKITFPFSNLENINYLYGNAFKLFGNKIRIKTIQGLLGANKYKYIGEIAYSIIQLYPCTMVRNSKVLVISGIDQKPYFELCNNIFKKMGIPEPIIIYFEDFPNTLMNNKMSSSINTKNSIYLSDSDDNIALKIKKSKTGRGFMDQESIVSLNNDFPYFIQSVLFEYIEPKKKLYAEGKITSESFKKGVIIQVLKLIKEFRVFKTILQKQKIEEFKDKL